MKTFNTPYVEVEKFNIEDVITASGECTVYDEDETEEDRG